MNGPSHLAFGAAGGLIVLPLAAHAHHADWSRPTVLGLSLLTAALAKLPDWDFRLGIPHRTVTHSLAMLGALWALGWWGEQHWGWLWSVRWVLVIGVGVGGILPDCLTEKGCPLLWPWPRSFKLPKWAAIKTKQPPGRPELVVRYTLVNAIAFWAVVLPAVQFIAPHI